MDWSEFAEAGVMAENASAAAHGRAAEDIEEAQGLEDSSVDVVGA